MREYKAKCLLFKEIIREIAQWTFGKDLMYKCLHANSRSLKATVGQQMALIESIDTVDISETW